MVAGAALSGEKKKHTICFVCDFFYPNFGGVENHIYYLSKGLQKLGHEVIVITHSYDGHRGLCYISEDRIISADNKYSSQRESEINIIADAPRDSSTAGSQSLKVYYVPKVVVYQQASLPSLYSIYGTIRRIFVQEGVQIVHGHQSTSTMAHECMFIARAMGLKTVFTEHSLYGFAELFSMDRIINKVLKMTLSDVDHVICVSNSCRDNLVSRVSRTGCPAFTCSAFLSTIPNAIDGCKFVPDHTKKLPRKPKINVVIMSRFVYRKGIDMVVQLIPLICAAHKHVYFIIGGDGPKRNMIQEMISKYALQDQVELNGVIPHEQVRDFLVRGHIFLNCSLTESFCMSLVEAAACGLHVVSTNVGGVPEVLPSSMTQLVEPNLSDLQQALSEAVEATALVQTKEENKQVHEENMRQRHKEILAMHSWDDVTDKTVRVYDRVAASPQQGLWERLKKYSTAGVVVGPLACFLAVSLNIWDRYFQA